MDSQDKARERIRNAIVRNMVLAQAGLGDAIMLALEGGTTYDALRVVQDHLDSVRYWLGRESTVLEKREQDG